MLKSYRKGVIALAAAVSFVAGAAQAGTHSVLIMDGGYFPEVIYVQPGDSIVFENMSASAHRLVGQGDAWTSGDISPEDSFEIVVDEQTPLSYSGRDSGGMEVEGALSFDPAPLQDAATD